MADNKFKYDIAKSFQRTNAFPLDVTSVFTSLADATAYAKGQGPLGKSSYAGQVLAVVDGTSVDVYKIGFDTTTGEKVLLSIGSGDGGGQAVTTQSIQIGNRTIPVGCDLTSSLTIVSEVIRDLGSVDGKIANDIVVDGNVVAASGTSVTTVLADVYTKIFHNGTSFVTEDIVNASGDTIINSGDTVTEAFNKIVELIDTKADGLSFDDDGDIAVERSGDTVTISINGVSNNETIVLDEKKTVTLQFDANGGTFTGTSLVDYTWGDFVEFELPSGTPAKGTSQFLGWQIDTDATDMTTDLHMYQPGETVQIVNITQISGDYTATATALWNDGA